MRRFREFATALLAVWAATGALSFAGCSPETDDAPLPGAIVLVDALGDTVRLAGRPKRVVSLAPSLTEMVYVLGQEDRLVGVTEYCDYPPEAADKPRVSGFSTLSHEAVLAARPDVALSARGNPLEELRTLREMGVPVFAFDMPTLNDLVDGAATLGRVLGCTDIGDSVSASWRERIARVQGQVGKIPYRERPSVFFGGPSEPIYTTGPGGFIHDVIEAAGGRNLFGDLHTPWPRVDLETVVARDPDVILATYHARSDSVDLRERLRSGPGWASMSAVRSDRIIFIGDSIMRDGPRLIDALETLFRGLYAGRSIDG